LQSLDRDADAENGIRVSPAVARLFQGVSLNLSQKWDTFLIEYTLRHALGQANTRRLFSYPHGTINPAFAVRYLYESLGVDAQIYAEIRRQFEENVDGEIRGYINSSEYDSSGYVTRQLYRRDDFLDEYSWQYSPSGYLTRGEFDAHRDIPNQVWSWQYDAFNNVTVEEYQNGAWGYLHRHQYSADGNVIRDEEDRNADGTADKVTIHEYEYDASGRLTRHEVAGKINDLWIHEYDASGNLIHIRREQGLPEGRPAELWDTYYDAIGNVTRETVDRDANGVPEKITTHQYDDEGNRIHEREELYSTEDGILYFVQINEYDSHGNQILYERDRDADGTSEEIIRHTYEYDAHGNVILMTRDEDADGTPEQVERHAYEYDSAGNLARLTNDFDGDGAPEWITTYQYDQYGNRTQEAADKDANGAPEEFLNISYTYTGWGFIFDSSAPIRTGIFNDINDPGTF
jgi:serralysin